MVFDKSVEIEMREFVGANADAIAKKQTELHEEFQSDLTRCVGRRVTDANLECIRQATTKAQLNECRWSIF